MNSLKKLAFITVLALAPSACAAPTYIIKGSEKHKIHLHQVSSIGGDCYDAEITRAAKYILRGINYDYAISYADSVNKFIDCIVEYEEDNKIIIVK